MTVRARELIARKDGNAWSELAWSRLRANVFNTVTAHRRYRVVTRARIDPVAACIVTRCTGSATVWLKSSSIGSTQES